MIGRTSSQDPSVEKTSNVVVATASLEVGFDDDSVGAVLQHKSPHSDAAFVQRRGRAGRPRAMRPWTAIVLSDYGRDRNTYQSYDRLFDPHLAPRALPTANPTVLRMQAVFSLLDWIAKKNDVRFNVWRVLTKPVDPSDQKHRAEQLKLVNILEDLVTKRAARDALSKHLQWALGIDSEVVETILWDPPRPLLTVCCSDGIASASQQLGHRLAG